MALALNEWFPDVAGPWEWSLFYRQAVFQGSSSYLPASACRNGVCSHQGVSLELRFQATPEFLTAMRATPALLPGLPRLAAVLHLGTGCLSGAVLLPHLT